MQTAARRDPFAPPSRAILLVLAAIAALLLLAACSDPGPASRANASSQADQKITLRRGNGAEPDTLDPQKTSGTWENNIVSDMFEGLMTVGPDGQPIYGAAISHTVSPDGLVYTYKLRPGMVWSDGVPVTADDFVFSFQRILDPKTAAQYASLLYPIKNAKAVNEGSLPPSAVGVKALDPMTVQITLEAPTPYLPTLLTHQTTQPVPKHVVEKYGDKWTTAGIMVSNGPYILSQWIPNTYVKLVKNPRYYDADKVQIEVVYFYPISDSSDELDRYKAGELDMTSSVPLREVPRLKISMPDQLHISPYMANTYLQINIHRAPLDDIRVRKALSLAIDRAVICDKILKAGEIPAFSFVPPSVANYESGAELPFAHETMAQRQKEARDLLKQAGFGPDHPLTFTYRYIESVDNRRVAIAIASMWKAIGVNAQLFNNDTREHYNALRAQDFEVADAGWVADYNDAENFLFLMESTSGQMNYSKYANPQYDDLLHKAAVTQDPKARADILRQAEQIMLDDYVVIPEYFATSRHLLKPAVKGYEDNVLDWHRTRYLRLDRASS